MNEFQAASLVYWMKYAPNKLFIPASVDIDLTNTCNQDCFYCNSADHRKASPGGPTASTYIKLLDKLATWRKYEPNSVGTLHTVTFPGGGEPTLLKGYERVIEHSIDLGFLTSMTTNGFKLDRLIDNVSADKLQKLGWIGVDVDAGTPDLYEQIRRTLNKKTFFHKMVDNVSALRTMGVNVDFKILMCDINMNTKALHDIFALAKQVNIRLLYFRPVLLNGVLFNITPELVAEITKLSQEYNQEIKINVAKSVPRTYSRCHQMFQFPVFCADGHIYTCCENKGNPRFSIGRWDQGDFRDIWLDKQHWDVYNSINTNLCQPCRPNKDNIEIQQILDNPIQIETLYL
jgi:sulfatase maturation enzyme AslB (radical SAM superfamily)